MVVCNRPHIQPNWAIENQNGILYFVDHASNTTTYTDPRIEIKKNLIQQHNQLSLQNNVSIIYVNIHNLLYWYLACGIGWGIRAQSYGKHADILRES